MSKLFRFEKNDIFVVLFMIITTVIGRFFRIGEIESSLIWPAIGIAFAFALAKRFRVFPAIFIGASTGYFTAFTIVSGFQFLFVLVAMLQAAKLMVSLAFLITLWDYFKISEVLNFINILRVAFVIFLIAGLDAVMGNTIYLIVGFDTGDVFLENIMSWLLGDTFGMIIFGIPYYLALKKDHDPYYISFDWKEVLFYLIFIVVTALMLIEQVPYLNYIQHRYIFIIFAIVMAFNYGFRTPVAFSMMVLIMMSIWPPMFTDLGDYYFVIGINTFLVVLTGIVFIIKHFVDTNNERQIELQVKSDRLDDLFTATQDLLNLSNELSSLAVDRIDSQAKKIFRVVFTLFNKADYGACMIIDSKVTFIDVIGFDIKVLNNMPNVIEDWITFDEPTIIKNSEKFVKDQLGEFYTLYREKNSMIKESIFMTIHFTEKIICTLSFDLDYDSSKSFDDNDMLYFNSMQKLLNGLYQTDDLITEYETTKDQLVDTMIKTIRVFDEDLMNHSIDVAKIAKALAEHYHLDDQTVGNLYWAGIMHDIGKLGLPKILITKPSTYSLAEYERMKEHPRLGFEALKGSQELKPIAQYVLSHHERRDGSGYPEGLSGERISLPMEILAIAEVIATMVREQPYSPKKTLSEVITELKSLSDQQFSKECINLALRAIQYGLLDDFY